MHSNSYTFIYATILTIITAILLAFATEGLRPAQEANIALEKKKNVLASVRIRLEERKEIEAVYGEKIKAMVIDKDGNEVMGFNAFDIVVKAEKEKKEEERKMPLYIFSNNDGKKYFIIPLYGIGLWGPIWGYISLHDDFNTVYGAYFDHKGETPGLGAEIGNYDIFQQPFEGKKIFDGNNNFVSVRVVKKGQGREFADDNKVDGISGGTITSKGTDKMIMEWLEMYMPYINKMKAGEPISNI